MNRYVLRQSALIWLLVLTTVAWGTVVVGHQHGDAEGSVCEISILPHQTSTAPTAVQVLLKPAAISTVVPTVYAYRGVSTSPYRSRAPPA
ncbi:MAG: hypothetical protein CMK32_14780 [Porticoccaceae bacterium]|nr:hypothetical protein [Porticoccaceae bacterium]